jgi:hypothetical protein
MTIKLKLYNVNKKSIVKSDIENLYKKQFNTNLMEENSKIIYGLYDDNKFVGYAIYIILPNNITKIDWIYAPNYGYKFMKKIESKLKRNQTKKIILNLSIDPTENKIKVMKRINFYINLHYKVYDIKFREKYGPLLYMEKNL